MGHFTDESWFDLARKLLPSEEAQAMQRHLDKGCQECARLAEIWNTVASKSSLQGHYQPADPDVRVVKAAFGARMQKILNPKKIIPATLTFDSIRHAAPAGFRAILLQARHLVHHAGPWTIALRLKTQPGNQMFVAGHVARSGALNPEEFQITLGHAGTLRAETRTNLLGEFHFQSTPEPDMHIHVWITPDEAVEIQLPPMS